MKSRISLRRLAPTLSLTVIALCSAAALAQNPAAGPAGESQMPPGTRRINLEITNSTFVVDGKKKEATIVNVAEHLRTMYPEVNIILAPGVGDLKVEDLRLRNANIYEISDGFEKATGNLVVGRRDGEGRNWTFAPGKVTKKPDPVVEVFNVGGYIEFFTWGKPDPEKLIAEKLDEVERIVVQTLADLKGGSLAEEAVSFRFHRGTSLLIVTGTPRAIDVARKVISSLPGQAQWAPKKEAP